MLPLKYIRENKDFVQDSLSKKHLKTDLAKLLELDGQRRRYLQEVEQLRAEKNKVSNTIAGSKKAGVNVEVDIAAMRSVSDRIKVVESELREVEDNIESTIYYIPNIVHSSVPVGNNETSNVEIKKW